MSSTSPYPRGHSGNTAELRHVFICRVHQLIELGYARMNPSAFQSTDEPDITGELICAIDQVCDDPESEGWISFFTPHDDPPVNDPMRKGKNRRKVDIRIGSGEYRPRQKFHFEAKRLGKGLAVGVYLGPEGLGRFLRGEYARDEDMAGMLGYVQSEDPQHWADKIQAAIAKSPQSPDTDLLTVPESVVVPSL